MDTWEVKGFYLQEKSDIKITLEAIPITIFVYKDKLKLFVLEQAGVITFNTRRFVTFSEDAKAVEGAEYLSYIASVLWIQRGKVFFTFEDLQHSGTAHGVDLEESDREPAKLHTLIQKQADILALKIFAKSFETLAPNEQAHIWRKASKGYRPEDIQAQQRAKAKKEAEETHNG